MRRAYMASYYRERTAEGRCWQCPKPAQPNRTRCRDCARAESARVLARYHARKLKVAA
jgi:hypothetical protein